MKKTMFAILAAFAVAAAAPAEAQLRPFEISIAGGPSFVTGDYSDVAGTGYHVQGSLGFSVPLLPFGLRADLLWQELPYDIGDGHIRHIGGLLNGTFELPMPILTPYLLAGVGLINQDVPGIDSSTEFGFNAGVGLEFPFVGMSAFAEARWLNLLGNDDLAQSIPVSVGIRF